MRKKSSLLAVAVLMAGVFLAMHLPPPAAADQPQIVDWKIQKAKPEGRFTPGGQAPRGDDRVKVELFANPQFEELQKSYLVILFQGCGQDPQTAGRPVLNLNDIILDPDKSPEYAPEWSPPGPRWRVCPNKSPLLLKPGASAKLVLYVDFLREVTENLNPSLRGLVYEVPEDVMGRAKKPGQLADLVSKMQPMGEVVIELFYAMDSQKLVWKSGSWEDIFGQGMPEGEGGMDAGDYEKEMANLPVIATAFKRTLPLPGAFEDDQGARFDQTIRDILSLGSGRAGQQPECWQDEEFTPRQLPGANAIPKAGPFTLSGVWSTKWTVDHSLHPGFGFRVEAWTNEGGPWRMLASDWVQSNGTWSLVVPAEAGWAGTNLRMLYRSYNSYYAPQNQAGNKYSWKGPDRAGPIGLSHNEGHWYANTDGGTYNGVGELVDAAMRMWSRLYWAGGINPVPSGGAYRLYFPNTWNNCGGSSPWSCANTSGNIWLIASHGTRAEVVTHELAHQLNFKFWNNKLPANSGGSHSLNGCYPTRLGMALTEGFANFIPGWVGYQTRNVAEGGFGAGRWALSYDLESRVSPPSCANGWENEVWVARVFWDLHDVRADGDDILNFVHMGAVPAIYLNHGVANNGDARDMRFYEGTYQGYASAGHAGFITDIFEQNRH